MNVWLIIPAKPFGEGKTRLASVMDAGERERLNRDFLKRTLRIAQDVFPPDRTVVISRSTEARALATGSGAHALEEGAGTLNDALHAASNFSHTAGAEAVLSLSTDLPFLEAEDLRAMLDAPPGVAIACDRRGVGTNALLIQPPGLIEYRYGNASFPAHCMSARAAGAHLEIIDRPGLSLDIDTPEDWRLWQAADGTPR